MIRLTHFSQVRKPGTLSRWAMVLIMIGAIGMLGAYQTGWTIVESFDTTADYPAGSSLDGKPFDEAPSGTQWKAQPRITLAQGGYAVYDGSKAQTNATASVPILHDAPEGAIYTVTADVRLKNGLFMVIGLLDDHRGFFQGGQVWLMIRHGGRYELRANGMTNEQYVTNKPKDVFKYRQRNEVTLIYNSAKQTTSVKSNGELVLEDHDLSAFADAFNLTRVGFSHYTGRKATSKDVHELHRFELNIADSADDSE